MCYARSPAAASVCVKTQLSTHLRRPDTSPVSGFSLGGAIKQRRQEQRVGVGGRQERKGSIPPV